MELRYLLDQHHDEIDYGNVVDCPADVLRLVEEGLRVAHIVTDPDAPQQEQELPCKTRGGTVRYNRAIVNKF